MLSRASGRLYHGIALLAFTITEKSFLITLSYTLFIKDKYKKLINS